MNDVFISYSRRDKVFTQKLYEALKAVDRIVWADWDSIPAASDWDAEIKQGIQETNSVLFVLSPEWIKSNECRKEMVHAVAMGKRLFPILYLPVDPNDVPPELAKINWVYMRDSDDFDKAFQTLCSAIDTDLDWIKTHTRIQVRALEWERKNRSASFALRGEDLTEGEQFIASGAEKSPTPTHLQSEYVLASRKDATRRQRQTLAGVTVALVVSIALGVAAFFQKQEAVRQREEAVKQATISRSGELAAQSELLNTQDFHSSLLLGVEAFRTLDRVQTRGALFDSAGANPHLIQFFSSQAGYVGNVQYSPDGNTIASIGSTAIGTGGATTLWNAKTLQPINQPFPKDQSITSSILFSPDGKILASGQGLDILLWDLTDPIHPKQIGQPLTGHTNYVSTLAFNPNGKTLASGSGDKTTILWDISDPTHPSQLMILKGHDNVVTSVAFSPDGKILASAASDFKINLWDVVTGQLIQTLEGPHPNSIAFSPDGKILASGNEDNTVILWNVGTGQPIGQPLAGHTDVVTTVVFNFDGSLLASSSRDTTIILWDTTTGRRIGQPLIGHAGAVNSITFNPGNNTLVSGGADGMILWDAEGHDILPQLITTDYYHCGRVYACPDNIAISMDGKILATGAFDNSINLWNLETLQPIGKPLIGSSSEVFSIALSPDGKTLASGSLDSNDILLWNTSTGQLIGEPLKGHEGFVNSLSFTPDGNILVSSGGGTIRLWDMQTLQPAGNPIQEDANDIDISPDGKQLATSSLAIWSLEDPAHPQKIHEPISFGDCIAFSPDGKILALGTQDGSITLWDTATLQEIGLPLTGHTGAVLDVAFSPDGKTLVSAGWDFKIVLWDVSNPLQPQRIGKPYRLGDSKVISVAFSSLDDGNLLVTGNSGKLLLWNLSPQFMIEKSCQRAGRNFTRAEWTQYFPNEEYRKTCSQWPLESEVTATPTATP